MGENIMLMGINGVLFIQKDGFGGLNHGDKHAENHLTGWWLTYPSEKYEFVSWDDYSQYMEK